MSFGMAELLIYIVPAFAGIIGSRYLSRLANFCLMVAVFQFDVPAASLPPGLYTCQVNVVDDVAGAFTFPRMQLYVRKQ